mgnify:CR=1 FL=1
MTNLELLQYKLNNIGYNTFLKEENGITYLKGGYSGEDPIKSLTIDIKVLFEEGKFIFIDWEKQISSKKTFDNIVDTIEYIERIYPI